MAPENTLASFRRAHDAGAAWVELDVRRSSDEVLVVSNSAYTADGTPLLVQSAEDLAHAGLVTLPDVLEALPEELGLLVEIKNRPGEPDYEPHSPTIDLLARLIAGTSRPLLATCSFDRAAIGKLRLLEVPTVWLHDPNISAAAGVAVAATLGAAAVGAHVDTAQLSRATTESAHERGLAVLVWAADTAEAIGRAFDAGVDAVCTDFPDLAAQVFTTTRLPG